MLTRVCLIYQWQYCFASNAGTCPELANSDPFHLSTSQDFAPLPYRVPVVHNAPESNFSLRHPSCWRSLTWNRTQESFGQHSASRCFLHHPSSIHPLSSMKLSSTSLCIIRGCTTPVSRCRKKRLQEGTGGTRGRGTKRTGRLVMIKVI